MTSISGSIIWIMWIYYVKPTALLGLSNYRDYTLHCRTCCGLQVCISIFFSVMWMLLLPTWISLEMIPTINFPLSFQNFRLQTPLSRGYQNYCTLLPSLSNSQLLYLDGKWHVFPGAMLSYPYRSCLHSPLFACTFRVDIHAPFNQATEDELVFMMWNLRYIYVDTYAMLELCLNNGFSVL